MKNFSVLFLLIFFSLSLYSQSGKIIRIKDGDTVVLLDSDNNQITLRLAEVDCPESSQAFGKKSKEFTSNEVGNKMVSYKIINTDRYGRYIAKIFYNNKYLSEEIIRNGYGWHYKQYSKSKKLSDLEINARNKKIGLWNDKKPIEPYMYRKMNKY
ncbi:Endonuclease YncB, thermonuclease family [Flavobacterium frigidimaris]|nr:Endonuclease YncB, thermonuclease family [Flavobacterium frigidimaris]